jgi:hypothetical protein
MLIKLHIFTKKSHGSEFDIGTDIGTVVLWNSKLYFRIQRILVQDPILCQMSWVHIFQLQFLKSLLAYLFYS